MGKRLPPSQSRVKFLWGNNKIFNLGRKKIWREKLIPVRIIVLLSRSNDMMSQVLVRGVVTLKVKNLTL